MTMVGFNSALIRSGTRCKEEWRQPIGERDEQISDERWLGDLLLNIGFVK